MKYALMTYMNVKNTFNVGDYIQSLAAKQFLPQVDTYINREELGQYDGDLAKIIMNGWFTHKPKTWIPSNNLHPLFLSFHINSNRANDMLSTDGIAYLKKYEPIGCRDYYTVRLLEEKGIKAFFSGCLTLTLDSYRSSLPREDKIYIADPLYGLPNKDRVFSDIRGFVNGIVRGDIWHLGDAEKFMKKIFSENLLNNAEYIKQEPSSQGYTEEQKFNFADKLLRKYSRAKLVITSRIHCALPCLAMGTPVIYLNAFEQEFDACRMEGISELFNTININRKTGEITSNFDYGSIIDEDFILENKKDYLVLKNNLKKIVNDFITKKAQI